MAIHTVKRGETLSGIARQHGLKSWQEIYNHPSNAGFRTKRPNPNLIHPGDQINIPTSPGRPVVPVAPVDPRQAARLGKFAKHAEAMRQELLKDLPAQRQKLEEDEFLKFLEQTKADWDKAFFVSDRVEDAIKIVRYYRAMRDLQLPLSEIKGIVPIITKFREGDKFIKAVITPGGKLGRSLKVIGKTGKLVGFVGCGMQVYVHWAREDYYAAASELYKTGMGLGVPWAGLVDGVEGFTSGMQGDAHPSKRDERFWRYLRWLNIIGLGTAGIDAVGTMVHIIVTRDMDSHRMDRLVARLRNSPAQVFLEMGEDLSRALTYFEQMPEDEFREAMSAQNFYNWIRYSLTGKMPK